MAKTVDWRNMELMLEEIAAGTSAEDSGLVKDDATRKAWDSLAKDYRRMKKSGTVMELPTEFPGDDHDDAIKVLYKDF